MSFFAVLFALLLEQVKPLPRGNVIHDALTGWMQWTARNFDAGRERHAWVVWCVTALAPALLTWGVFFALEQVSSLLGLAFDVAVLYLTLGFRQFSHYFTDLQLAIRAGEVDRARELIGAWRGEPAQHRSREEVIRLAIEEALVASHRHVFGVLFWYLLLPGPSGAILYRLALHLRRRWQGLGAFGAFAERVYRLLEWPAVRLTAASFAVVGDFEDAVYCWRTQAASWSDPDAGVVLAAGAGAMGVRLGMPLGGIEGVEVRPELGMGENADSPFLDSVVGLVWRALVVWVFVLVVLTLAQAF
jgi:cobalamin biosynthesis protein CobD/CbiB